MAGKKAGVAGKPVNPAREALQVTFVLKGNLKRAQLMCLFIARQLADVRDRELYAALGHIDMEDYAHQRLDLGRASLYNYLHIYDWVKQSHPEWLEKNVKGPIPDLSDISDLMWIETALAAKSIDPANRTTLEALQKKALAGTLRRAELREFREVGKTAADPLKVFLSTLQEVRKKAAKVSGLPPEVLAHLDSAINLASHDQALKVAGIRPLATPSAA